MGGLRKQGCKSPGWGGAKAAAFDPRSRQILKTWLSDLHPDPQSPALGLDCSSLMTPSHYAPFLSLFPPQPPAPHCSVKFLPGPRKPLRQVLIRNRRKMGEENLGEKSLISGCPSQFSEYPLHSTRAG